MSLYKVAKEIDPNSKEARSGVVVTRRDLSPKTNSDYNQQHSP
ncbi:MAG: hypothetical protein K0S29_918 [Gammaproteobacteria bacterium]|jgi:hypothetical protein|nr:hypothetical protein [Gammaproteobacteria bacterium]